MRTMNMLITAAAPLVCSMALAMDAPKAKVTPLMTKPLEGIAGKEAAMITVEIPPGAESPPHRHNASTLVYVLAGTVIMQVDGGKPVTLQVGETFYESPTDIHTVSRNPSTTLPAKLLVVLIKEVGAPIALPVK